MQLGDALRNLADLVDEIDESSAEVIDVTPERIDDGGMIADVTVKIPSGGIAEPGTAAAATDPRSVGTDDGNGIGITARERGDANKERTPAEEASGAEGTAPEPAVDTETAAPADDGTDGEGSGTGQDDPEAEVAEDGPEGVARDEPTDDRSSTDVPPEADGETVECTHEGCRATFDSEHGMRIHRSKAHDSGGSNRDSETLAAVYESHDSFEAMREALDADVSAQTVRRWMMNEGIHTPAGRSGPGDRTAEDSESDAADGDEASTDEDEAEREGSADSRVDSRDRDGGSPPEGWFDEVDEELPAGVSAAGLQEAVEESSTLYEVQQHLDVEREEARSVLEEFDLLELVHGRVADRRRREELKEEIDDRLRANASTADSRSD